MCLNKPPVGTYTNIFRLCVSLWCATVPLFRVYEHIAFSMFFFFFFFSFCFGYWICVYLCLQCACDSPKFTSSSPFGFFSVSPHFHSINAYTTNNVCVCACVSKFLYECVVDACSWEDATVVYTIKLPHKYQFVLFIVTLPSLLYRLGINVMNSTSEVFYENAIPTLLCVHVYIYICVPSCRVHSPFTIFMCNWSKCVSVCLFVCVRECVEFSLIAFGYGAAWKYCIRIGFDCIMVSVDIVCWIRRCIAVA